MLRYHSENEAEMPRMPEGVRLNVCTECLIDHLDRSSSYQS
jgi:hypothetical protein